MSLAPLFLVMKLIFAFDSAVDLQSRGYFFSYCMYLKATRLGLEFGLFVSDYYFQTISSHSSFKNIWSSYYLAKSPPTIFTTIIYQLLGHSPSEITLLLFALGFPHHLCLSIGYKFNILTDDPHSTNTWPLRCWTSPSPTTCSSVPSNTSTPVVRTWRLSSITVSPSKSQSHSSWLSIALLFTLAHLLYSHWRNRLPVH